MRPIMKAMPKYYSLLLLLLSVAVSNMRVKPNNRICILMEISIFELGNNRISRRLLLIYFEFLSNTVHVGSWKKERNFSILLVKLWFLCKLNDDFLPRCGMISKVKASIIRDKVYYVKLVRWYWFNFFENNRYICLARYFSILIIKLSEPGMELSSFCDKSLTSQNALNDKDRSIRLRFAAQNRVIKQTHICF